MQLLPIPTRLIAAHDNLTEVLADAFHENHLLNKVTENDFPIIVISSKAVATSEGRVINLKEVSVTEEAQKYAKKTGRSAEFCQAVLEETMFWNGEVRGTCPGAMLTELRPKNATGTILTANAGLDESNVPQHCTIGWPKDPIASASRLQGELSQKIFGGKAIAVIITDSCCRPRRWGVTAYALTVAGIDPLQSEAGKSDLYGRDLRITQEAVADQLSTAANMIMGNANQATPAVMIIDHGIVSSDFAGWVPGIEPAEDLFAGIM